MHRVGHKLQIGGFLRRVHKKYVASDVKHYKIIRVRYLFFFSGIGCMCFYRVMKHCLHLSVQLIYQDCFKCFGAGLMAYSIFACSNLEF